MLVSVWGSFLLFSPFIISMSSFYINRLFSSVDRLVNSLYWLFTMSRPTFHGMLLTNRVTWVKVKHNFLLYSLLFIVYDTMFVCFINLLRAILLGFYIPLYIMSIVLYFRVCIALALDCIWLAPGEITSAGASLLLKCGYVIKLWLINSTLMLQRYLVFTVYTIPFNRYK